ncbi:MAG: hypothetical protein JNK87_06395 [Bryobacterales bacterium]|nr:hypothetical protein [Bryobacterales bacterium]
MSNRLSQPILLALLTTLVGLYFVQLATPLRLNKDAIELLSMADSARRGTGFHFYGEVTQFPPGYPALIAALDFFGQATPPVFVAVNYLFLAVALGLLCGMLRKDLDLRPELAVLCCCLTLLSWVMIKHATLPLTDIPFLGVSTFAVWAMRTAEDRPPTQRTAALLAAWFACLLALTFRRLGIALFPALLWVFLSPGAGNWRAFLSIRRLIALAASGAVTVYTIVQTSTAEDALAIYHEGGFWTVLSQIVTFRLLEWGEIALNMPERFVPGSRAVLPAAGLFALVCVGAAMWTQRHHLSALKIYAVSCVAILTIWPYHDSRFWIPVLPLCIGFVTAGAQRVLRTLPARAFVAAYLAVFCIAGCGALAWTTRISFSADSFPRMYGDGRLRATYEVAFARCPDEAPRSGVIPAAMDVLRRFEPRTAAARCGSGDVGR